MTKTAYRFIYNEKAKLFLYEEKTATLYYVSRTTKEEIADNKEWEEKYNKPLFDTIGEYTVIDNIGLRVENWKNKDVRNEYLYEYCTQLDDDLQYML
jgi:hypothetical protein